MVNENKIDIFIRIWWKGGLWISLVWVEELVWESLIGCGYCGRNEIVRFSKIPKDQGPVGIFAY